MIVNKTNSAKRVKLVNINIAYTHAGSFHADDVFGTALLKMLNPDVTIKRVFKAPTNVGEDEIVFDIGFGAFDHHQKDGRVRPNGIKYAAFGLLWEKFGHLLIEDEEGRQMFDEQFVQPVDAQDNGQSDPRVIPVMTLSSGLGLFNPFWDETPEDPDRAFNKARALAKFFLERALEQVESKLRARDIVYKAVEKSADGIMVLDHFVPWQDWLFKAGPKSEELLYVVFPSNRGGYSIQTVPVAPGSFQGRKMLPREWWGKSAAELQELTGIKTLRFVHANGFLAATDTLEDAMAVAKAAVDA